jgi:integrase
VPPAPIPSHAPSGAHTLGELLAAYQRECLASKTRATQYNYHRFALGVVRELGDLPLDAVTPEVVRTWKLALLEHHKPGTVHTYMKRLDRALRLGAREYGWLATNPMDRVSKPSPGRGRVRFLSADERTRLLAACRTSRNPHLYALVTVALGTGGRRDEVRTLQWPQVDFATGVVRFLKTKTDVARAAPILGEALTVLQDLAQQRRSAVPWVFPTWDGQRPTPMESPWQTARDRAGLEDFHFHDLRHTFASYMAMSGASLRDIADALGHTNIQMTMIYAHLLPSHTRGVIERMTQQFLSAPVEEMPGE